MKLNLSLLTGIIYATNSKRKEDVTDDAISAVTIRMIEGFENKIIVTSKKDGKKYKLKLEEVV